MAKVGEMKVLTQIYGDFGGNCPFQTWPCLGWCSYTVMSPEGDGRLLPSGILWSHGGLSGWDQTLDWWMPLGWSMLRLTGNSGVHLICRFKDGQFRTKASIGFIGFRGDLDFFLNVFFLFKKTTWNKRVIFRFEIVGSKKKRPPPTQRREFFLGRFPCPHQECEKNHEV